MKRRTFHATYLFGQLTYSNKNSAQMTRQSVHQIPWHWVWGLVHTRKRSAAAAFWNGFASQPGENCPWTPWKMGSFKPLIPWLGTVKKTREKARMFVPQTTLFFLKIYYGRIARLRQFAWRWYTFPMFQWLQPSFCLPLQVQGSNGVGKLYIFGMRPNDWSHGTASGAMPWTPSQWRSHPSQGLGAKDKIMELDGTHFCM